MRAKTLGAHSEVDFLGQIINLAIKGQQGALESDFVSRHLQGERLKTKDIRHK